MTVESPSPESVRSRRALLLGALGGVGAWAVSAAGSASPVLAGVDGDVRLGLDNTASTPTSILNTSNANIVFQSLSTGAGVGVEGSAVGGTGVHGFNDATVTGYGVVGDTSATSSPGVLGRSRNDGTGVQGYSGASEAAPASGGKVGVQGVANQDTSSRGVSGKSNAGRGVYGESSTGYGVRGYSGTGTALFGQTSGVKVGVALRTIGKVKFDYSVGIATVAAGTNHIVVTPGIDLTTTTGIVATLQGSAGGSTNVLRVAVDTVAETFTIYLTANATSSVKVAWHAFG